MLNLSELNIEQLIALETEVANELNKQYDLKFHNIIRNRTEKDDTLTHYATDEDKDRILKILKK